MPFAEVASIVRPTSSEDCRVQESLMPDSAKPLRTFDAFSRHKCHLERIAISSHGERLWSQVVLRAGLMGKHKVWLCNCLRSL